MPLLADGVGPQQRIASDAMHNSSTLDFNDWGNRKTGDWIPIAENPYNWNLFLWRKAHLVWASVTINTAYVPFAG